VQPAERRKRTAPQPTLDHTSLLAQRKRATLPCQNDDGGSASCNLPDFSRSGVLYVLLLLLLLLMLLLLTLNE
jgi:hypothetical protein